MEERPRDVFETIERHRIVGSVALVHASSLGAAQGDYCARVDPTISWAAREDAASLAPQLVDLLADLSPANAALNVDVITQRLLDDRVRVALASAADRIVGAATLTLLVTLTDGLVGRVEDVVVSPAARGAGLGRQLMEALHGEARRLGLAHLDLTSRPSREAANGLYASLGYERRETNVYRLRLD